MYYVRFLIGVTKGDNNIRPYCQRTTWLTANGPPDLLRSFGPLVYEQSELTQKYYGKMVQRRVRKEMRKIPMNM